MVLVTDLTTLKLFFILNINFLFYFLLTIVIRICGTYIHPNMMEILNYLTILATLKLLKM
jgi:hypothetical protein